MPSLSILEYEVGEIGDKKGFDDLGIYSIYATHCQISESNKPRNYIVTVKIDNKPISMHIDTAADFSIMGKDIFESHFPSQQLLKSDVNLKTYTGVMMQM